MPAWSSGSLRAIRMYTNGNMTRGASAHAKIAVAYVKPKRVSNAASSAPEEVPMANDKL